MTIELPVQVEEELRGLAERQNRGVNAVVEDALRQYIVAAAITDLEPSEVAETQMALIRELRDISPWKDGGD